MPSNCIYIRVHLVEFSHFTSEMREKLKEIKTPCVLIDRAKIRT